MGAAAEEFLKSDLWPQNPEGTVPPFPEGNELVYFDFSATPANRLVAPFATFERASDFYGDGSLYIVDTPGHFTGHLSAVARVAPDAFVFLAGDVCHNRLCYSPGHRLVSEYNYADIEVARKSVQKLADLNRESENVVVILAHEAHRLEEGMPLFPSDVQEWVLKEIELRRAARA